MANIEELFYQPFIVGHRIDDLDPHRAHRCLTDAAQIGIRKPRDTVVPDGPGCFQHRGSDILGRWTSVGNIELDAEILVHSAGIMAGRQDNPAVGLVEPDQMRGGRRRQKPVLADDDL